MIDIIKGHQFSTQFQELNPNSKIPVLVDIRGGPKKERITIFESGSILVYLAEKYGRFISKEALLRAETFNWLFWQMAGLGPIAGQFNHFMNYTPTSQHEAKHYGVARFGKEIQRLCKVLDRQLEHKEYIVGNEYSIADIACFPWFDFIRKESMYKSKTLVSIPSFLSMDQFKHANKWADRVMERDAVKRGMTVCSFSGRAKPWVREN